MRLSDTWVSFVLQQGAGNAITHALLLSSAGSGAFINIIIIPESEQKGIAVNFEIPLDRMSTSDKLRALENIRDDLQRAPGEVPSQSWHADVLRVREEEYKEGSSGSTD